MTIETRVRDNSQPVGGGGSSNSGGLAGTGATYILSSLAAGFPNALYIKPGSSVTTHITGSNLFINATTSTSASSGGLAGTGNTYIFSSLVAGYPNALYIKPGSSVTTHITGSNLFINATTSAGGSSGGLAGTGGFFVLSTANTAWPNARQLQAGSSVIVRTDGTNIYVDAITGGGASSGLNFMPLLPQQSKLYPSNSAARIDAGTAWWRLLFSQITEQYAVWQFICPPDYGSNPYFRIAYALGSTLAAARSTTWVVEQWGIADGITVNPVSYLYLDTFGATNEFSVALSAGYSNGTVQMMTIPLVNAVSLGAGNLLRIRISNTGLLAGAADSILAGANFEYSRS